MKYCCRFIATPCIEVAAHALGLWWWTKKKAQLIVSKYLFKGPGLWPSKTLMRNGS